MRVVLTGASGDFGTALLRGLVLRDEVSHVVALARSPLRVQHPKIEQRAVDLATDGLASDDPDTDDPDTDDLDTSGLEQAFAGADAVIHCAFVVEEPRDKESARVVNVDGSRRVLRAADSAGARVCVMTSSINAYGPRGGPEVIDETAPIGAGEEHYYFHHKALMEQDVRRWRQGSDGRMAVAVLRPAYVVGPDMANSGLEAMRSRVVLYPSPGRSYFQFLHQDDLVDAYLRVVFAGVEDRAGGRAAARVDGEFNLGPEEALTVSQLCRMNRSVCVPVPLGPSRRLADLGFLLRLLPYSSHWVTRGEPVTTSRRLRDATGWRPRYSCAEAARLMLAG